MVTRVAMTRVVPARTGGTASEPVQTSDAGQTAQPAALEDTRHATSTWAGNTGLWFVPTGEVLPARGWSFKRCRVNLDYTQGFTDVTDFPIAAYRLNRPAAMIVRVRQ